MRNPGASDKKHSLQLFVFGQNAFETARANATIRKKYKFVLDFVLQNIQNDAVVAETAQFACSLDAARGRETCEAFTKFTL